MRLNKWKEEAEKVLQHSLLLDNFEFEASKRILPQQIIDGFTSFLEAENFSTGNLIDEMGGNAKDIYDQYVTLNPNIKLANAVTSVDINNVLRVVALEDIVYLFDCMGVSAWGDLSIVINDMIDLSQQDHLSFDERRESLIKKFEDEVYPKIVDFINTMNVDFQEVEFQANLSGVPTLQRKTVRGIKKTSNRVEWLTCKQKTEDLLQSEGLTISAPDNNADALLLFMNRWLGLGYPSSLYQNFGKTGIFLLLEWDFTGKNVELTKPYFFSGGIHNLWLAYNIEPNDLFCGWSGVLKYPTGPTPGTAGLPEWVVENENLMTSNSFAGVTSWGYLGLQHKSELGEIDVTSFRACLNDERG